MRRTAAWVLATMAGYAAGGVALHSPGASSLEASAWEPGAAAFGAVLGTVVGAWTGLLQMAALGRRSRGVLVAGIATVAVAHALADGAPARLGVPGIAVLSGVVAAAATSLAMGRREPRWLVAAAAMWTAGWMGGVALAGALGLSFGSSPAAWAREHLVIALCIGLAWGVMTAPSVRAAFARGRHEVAAGAAG